MSHTLYKDVLSHDLAGKIFTQVSDYSHWVVFSAGNMSLLKTFHTLDRTSGELNELVNLLQNALSKYMYFNDLTIVGYRDGNDFISWHSDYADTMKPNTEIGLLSLGGPRNIQLREKRYGDVDISMPEDNTITLPHNSLFVMSANFQDLYFHRIPPSLTNNNLRFSIVLYEKA